MSWLWGEVLWLIEKHISRRMAVELILLQSRLSRYLPRVYRVIRLADGQRGIVIRPPYAWFGFKYPLRLTMPWKAPRKTPSGGR
jgi:hypothetical protein